MKSQILIYPTMSRTEYCCRIFAFLISRRMSSPSEDTAAWRLLICARTTRSGMPS